MDSSSEDHQLYKYQPYIFFLKKSMDAHTHTHTIQTQLMIHNCQWSWIIFRLTEGQSRDKRRGSRQQLFGWAEYLLCWDSWKAGRRRDQHQSWAGTQRHRPSVIRIHRERRLLLFIHPFCPSVCRGGGGLQGSAASRWQWKNPEHMNHKDEEDNQGSHREWMWGADSGVQEDDKKWFKMIQTAEDGICLCAAAQSRFRSNLRQWGWRRSISKQVKPAEFKRRS